MEQKTKQLKNKKKMKILTINYKSNVDVENIQSNIHNLKNKIVTIFKNHVGIENGLSGWELMEKLYGYKLNEMNDYERFYYYNIVKRLIRVLRKDRLMIIVNQKRKFFVLQSMSEYINLRNLLNRDIKNMERLKDDAYNWVRLEKWRNI